MKKASRLNDPKTCSVEPFHYIYQTRQIRPHFSSPTNYFLCRTSRFLAHSFDCQPFTVFTLDKTIVKTCFTQYPESQIKNCLKTILGQFDDADAQEIPVLRNRRLNKELTKVADHMKSDISRLNGAIVANIEKRIEALNK